MAMYLEPRQVTTWQFSPGLSPEENVKVALTKMACFRQAATDETALDLYSEHLKDLDLRAFQVAMAIISETAREEGEPAFPSLGHIMDVIEEARERFFTPRHPILNTTPVFEGVHPALSTGKLER